MIIPTNVRTDFKTAAKYSKPAKKVCKKQNTDKPQQDYADVKYGSNGKLIKIYSENNPNGKLHFIA